MKYLYQILLAMTLLLMSSCSKNDYLNVIPKDATLVASIDLASVAEKGELAQSPLLKTADTYMSILNKDAQTKIKEYIDSPQDMGIDFSAPVVIFRTPAQLMGITMKVDDDDKLAEFFDLLRKNGLSSKPIERDDKYIGNILGDICFIYDDHTLMFLMATNGGVGSAALQQTCSMMISQSDDDSFTSTDTYSKMKDAAEDKDAFLYCSLASLPTNLGTTAKSLIPSGVSLSDVEMYASLSFEEGKAVLKADIDGKSDRAKKALDDANSHFHKIEGRYIDAPADDFVAWACTGVNGEWLLGTMKQDTKLKQLLFLVERAIDIEQIIRTVDGDLAITIPASAIQANETAKSDSLFDFIATAKVKDTKFLADVDYWKSSMREYNMSMREDGKNQYTVTGGDVSMSWGVDDDNVYIATTDAYRHNAFAKRSTLLKDNEDDIRNSQLYVYINLEQMNALTSASHQGGVFGNPLLLTRMKAFKSLIIRSESAHQLEVTVQLKDNNTNFLKQLF